MTKIYTKGGTALMRCACLVETRNDRLLLVRVRENSLWYLPGGKIEVHETPKEALVREILEELGVVVLEDSIVYLYTVVGPALGHSEEVELVCFSGRWEGEISTNGEISEIGWIDYSHTEKFAPAIKILVQKYLGSSTTPREFRFIGIDHVQVAIPKNAEATARDFYVEKLGMKEVAKPENLKKKGGLWVQAGRHQLHLGIWDPFTSATKAHPAFEVENLGHYREVLNERMVQTADEDKLEGANRFYVYDPFGNRIEFLEWENKANI